MKQENGTHNQEKNINRPRYDDRDDDGCNGKRFKKSHHKHVQEFKGQSEDNEISGRHKKEPVE